jgi:hypothetical protein
MDPFKKKNDPGTKVSHWNEESLQNVTFAPGENQYLNEHPEQEVVELNEEKG